MKEQREHKRFSLPMEASSSETNGQRKLQISDFSKSGFGITSDKPLPAGVDIELELFPPGESSPAIAKGQVVWMEERVGGRKQYKMGIKLKKTESHGWLFNFLHNKWVKLKEKAEQKDEKNYQTV